MSKRDYYEVLGVDKSTASDEVKKSYRKLAMKYHPDRTANLSDKEKKVTEEKFKELQEAYAVLSDPQKKQMYDQMGHAGVSGNQGGGGGHGGFSGADFDDIFDMFGMGGKKSRGGGGSRAHKGRDLEFQIDIELEQSAFGYEKELTYPRTEKCSTCHGKGAKNDSDIISCKTCNGVGQVRYSQGFFSIQQDCPDCHGAGKTIKTPCSNCRGNGMVKENKTIKLNIPAGIDEGATLRVSGAGESSFDGGQNGDLHIHIHIKPHKFFTRKENDLYCEVPITFITATLGAEIDIPTIDNKIVKLKIPEGTQTNSNLRIKDKGIKSMRGYGYGDLYCRIFVETPVKLSEEQKQLLQQFAKCGGNATYANNHPKHHSFLDRFKNLFTH